MKKWMNTLFFGGFFIASVIIEIYCIFMWEGNPISTIALGLVVLITGYLFMDSIRSWFIKSCNDLQFFMSHMVSEDNDKWKDQYVELLNLQKATYTATKKSNAASSELLEGIMGRLDQLEKNNENTMQRIIELQKKLMEGQKKALNLEIKYNKENTKQIISVLKEEIALSDRKEQLLQILALLENGSENRTESKTNNRSEHTTNVDSLTGFIEDSYMENSSDRQGELEENDYGEIISDMDTYQVEETYDGEDEDNDGKATVFIENAPESEDTNTETEADISIDNTENNSKVVPLYDDPNKALSADEIAALFASFGQ